MATNAILVKSNWRGAAFRDILAQEMRPYDGSFFQICGNDFDCSPDLAAFLALGVLELITNAVKYGALSRPGGTVNMNGEAFSGCCALIDEKVAARARANASQKDLEQNYFRPARDASAVACKWPFIQTVCVCI